jgi:uncharacterized membrane protein YcaP (DUF421 family)
MPTSFADFLSHLFLEDAHDNPFAMVALKAITVYLAGLIIVRFGKSQMISRASPLDVLFGFMLGALLSRGITGSASIVATTVAALTLVVVHWVFSWIACRSPFFGQLIKGRARLVIDQGQLLHDALRASHTSEQDLRESFRLNGNLDDASRVRLAYKERSGEISIVKADPQPCVIEIAVRDGVQTVRIELVA